MIKPIQYGVLLFFPVLLVSMGCASQEPVAEDPSSEIDAAAEHAPHELNRLEELYWSRTEASRQNFVQADVDFMSDMIVHHAQALIMAELSETNGANPRVKRLSARIFSAQKDEIALMQQWLRDRKQPVPLVSFDGIVMQVDTEPAGAAEMKDHHQTRHDHDREEPKETDHQEHTHHGHQSMSDHGHDHHDMPGMLSQEQLEELAAARGRTFDRLFLSYMIEHHEGAVIMVNELFAAEGAAQDLESYRLAVDIYAEQVTEINMMRLMLEDMGFDVPPSILDESHPSDHQPQHHHHH